MSGKGKVSSILFYDIAYGHTRKSRAWGAKRFGFYIEESIFNIIYSGFNPYYDSLRMIFHKLSRIKIMGVNKPSNYSDK
jgi:hypothetical protein